MGPGAIRLGPDGMLYVTSGTVVNQLFGTVREGTIVRFDPAASAPRPQTFASGLRTPNGASFDPTGNLYVADSSAGVVRIRSDGTLDQEWTAQAPRNFDVLHGVNGFFINGAAVAGDALYVTVTATVNGRILRIPLDAPARTTVEADLFPGVPSAMPDDLAVGADGMLYVTTRFGQLVRVDPRTHMTCTILSGLPMTSVAVTPGADNELFIGTDVGDILRVRLTS
ncbi:hypothetical protein ACIBCN_16335 [Nocardia sp. NPDC051052]|uniref:hypothetical protein n=1 Tax=Nocardia sp. NPDC051052 TaxID=3364322 RepID=UPI003789E9A9